MVLTTGYTSFIDSERYPVMDSYAIKMVKFHLGPRNYSENQERPYGAFVQNFQKLKTLAGLNVSNRDLDRYLWIAGEYSAFRKNREAEISAEVKHLFTNSPDDTATDIAALLPSVL
jgi:hypothetical protein